MPAGVAAARGLTPGFSDGAAIVVGVAAARGLTRGFEAIRQASLRRLLPWAACPLPEEPSARRIDLARKAQWAYTLRRDPCVSRCAPMIGSPATWSTPKNKQSEVAMKVEKALDPTSLVARIVAELRANPEAQEMLLRVLLTNEFLGMPARLDRIEKDVAELKVDVTALKADVATLKTDVATLKTDMVEVKTGVAKLTNDVAYLKGSDLEHRLLRKIRALLSQELDLKGLDVVQTPLQWPEREFFKAVDEAVADGRIVAAEGSRIDETDFIIRAQRKTDRVPVWVAIEASHTVHDNDIDRARASADALRAVFGAEAVAVAAGYGINRADAERAEAAGVEYLKVPLPQAA